MTMDNIIRTLEAERMTRKVPAFKPGDTVVVQIKVVEGDRERVQAYEGVVIARSNRGFNSSFTVRKVSHGEGVERTFQTYSPSISEIAVKRRGRVRRAGPARLHPLFRGAQVPAGGGGGASLPDLRPEHQRDCGQAPRQRAAREALLSARAHRQGRAHRGRSEERRVGKKCR